MRIHPVKDIAKIAVLVSSALILSACAQSVARLSPDFGQSVNRNIASQVADPDARYEGAIAPGSDGARAALAQKRYQTNTVIQPSSITASSAGSIGHADNGGGNAAPTGVAP